MNNKYILLLEQFKNNIDVENEMTIDVYQEIANWYDNNIGHFEDMKKALDIMCYFYMHENFDVYDVNKFKDECDYLRVNYGIPQEKALLVFESFRNLVYKA